MKPEWIDVPGYEGLYQVSYLGKVRSVDRCIPNSVGLGSRFMKGKELQSKVRYSEGPQYPRVALSKFGVVKYFRVHTLVLEAYVGPKPFGMECCHNDGNFNNCHLSNLRWDTPIANQRDRSKHGTANQGSRQWKAKIDETQAKRIKEEFNLHNCSRSYLARKYNISIGIVSSIVSGRNWRHV